MGEVGEGGLRPARVGQGGTHGAHLPNGRRLGQVAGVAGLPVADDFRQDGGAPGQGLFLGFKQQDGGAFPQYQPGCTTPRKTPQPKRPDMGTKIVLAATATRVSVGRHAFSPRKALTVRMARFSPSAWAFSKLASLNLSTPLR